MRYTHESSTRIRHVLLTRLSYIITLMINNGKTQVELAEEAGVTPHAISAIKNKRFTAIGLDRILMVADGLGLDYEITRGNHGGQKFERVSLPSYDNDQLMQMHRHVNAVANQATTGVH